MASPICKTDNQIKELIKDPDDVNLRNGVFNHNLPHHDMILTTFVDKSELKQHMTTKPFRQLNTGPYSVDMSNLSKGNQPLQKLLAHDMQSFIRETEEAVETTLDDSTSEIPEYVLADLENLERDYNAKYDDDIRRHLDNNGNEFLDSFIHKIGDGLNIFEDFDSIANISDDISKDSSLSFNIPESVPTNADSPNKIGDISVKGSAKENVSQECFTNEPSDLSNLSIQIVSEDTDTRQQSPNLHSQPHLKGTDTQQLNSKQKGHEIQRQVLSDIHIKQKEHQAICYAYQCKHCRSSFSNESMLAKHVDRMHLFNCELCCKRFNTPYMLKRHSKVHVDGRPFMCDICAASFKRLDYLKKHSQSHSEETSFQFQCNVCDKYFKYQISMQRHMNIHSKENLFECNVCDKTFTWKSVLKRHLTIHTGEKLYSCKICSKSFNQAADLKKHLRIHNGDKPFKCEICPATFNTSSSLRSHEATHDEERSYNCAICSAAFKLNRNLKRHMKTHNCERSYVCDICSASFTQKRYLTKHVKIHTNTRSFKCTECKAAFNFKWNLIDHLRVHRNDRPYKCSVCATSFKRSANLTRHIRVHIKDRLYDTKVSLASASH